MFIKGNAEKEADREQRLAEHDAIFPPPPEHLGYLWDWFHDLSDWRDSSMGVGPLSHQEIECWGRVMQIHPIISPFEYHVLRQLDRECRAYHNTKDKPEHKYEEDPSATPIADALREMAARSKAKKEKK